MEGFVFLCADGVAERVAEDRVDLSFGGGGGRRRIWFFRRHIIGQRAID